MAHDSPASGHLGSEKTLVKVRERFYWPTLFRDVSRYCRTCHSCQSRKDPPKARYAPLQKMPVPTRPFEFVSVDHTGRLPLSSKGNQYILVISCLFSKWVECIPVRTMKADLTADILVREVVCRYGVPERIHSDQGGSFEAEVVHNMCKSLGIDKSRTSPYHPEGNGQTERFNDTVKNMLSHYVNKLNQRDWDLYLPLVLFGYRTSQHAVTKFSPYELLFCRRPQIPLDCLLGSQVRDQQDDPVGKVLELQHKIPEVMKIVREYMSRAQDVRNARRDVEGFQPYQVGDLVMVRNKRTKKGLSPKLRADRWIGPYRVRKAVSDVNYRVQQGRRKILAHYNNLKPYYENPQMAPDRLDDLDLPDEPGVPEATLGDDGDECQRFDVDLDVLEGAGDELQEVPRAVPADLPVADVPGVDGPAVVPGPVHSPVMKDHGRRWCNIDPRNVMTGGRRRGEADAVNLIKVRRGGPWTWG